MNVKKDSNKSARTYDLYVGHVPKSVKEAALREAFSKYGNVADVLIRHSTSPFGYAIVKFKQKKDVEKILRQIDNIIIDNHEMEIKSGKRSNQSFENMNGIPNMTKTVTFAEACPNVQYLDNIYVTETPVPMNDFQYPIYPGCESALIPVTVEIMCTHVEDAVTFHGCSLASFEELTHLAVKLNSICPNLQRLIRKPIINRVYGAMYVEDCQWYRCRVLQYGALVNSSSCIVQYIDYGNIAEICYTNMVELPEPLKNTNPFAFKCYLTNLAPTPKSLNCASYLHHLVNHRMSLCALHAWGSFEYLVTKCSCNGIDVINELVRNGYALYRTLEVPKNTSPKIDKSSKIHENTKQKKANDSHKSKKTANSCNGTSKNSQDGKNGKITILEKSDRSSSSVEIGDFIPKKIVKRENDAVVIDNNSVLEVKTVNHFLKVDSVISNVKVINNIRGLIPLHSYDDLISAAVDLLREELNITVSDDSKQSVENARKAYCDILKEIRECSDLNLLAELKKTRNQKRLDLCNELERFLNSFDCTLLEKRKKIQETITALESNSTAWLNVYLPQIPETIEDLLAAFNEEKERKRKKIEMSRRNTDEKRTKFLNIYTDLGKEFSLKIVNGITDDASVANNVGKKGSWALKFDEALTEFGIALEEERKISTVIEDRSYVSVIQYILEKLDIPKDKIDTECEVYEKYKLLYDDLVNSLDLNVIFEELHSVNEIISSFNASSDPTSTNKFSDRHVKLHTALLHEEALMATLVQASSQHFPELIREHPELRLEEYQKYFCLMKFSWDVHFFPPVDKCNRIESSYVSSLDDKLVVIKEFHVDCESEKTLFKRVKMWKEIKSMALVKIKGLFKNKHDSSRCRAMSCNSCNELVNGGTSHEIQIRTQKKILHDENQNTVANVNGESKDSLKSNCQWNDCRTTLLTHDELVLHVYESHIEKNDKSFVCQWKNCSTKEKPFKTKILLITHMQKHYQEKSQSCTTRNIIYAVLSPAWETLYDKPLPTPVDYKKALNVLQQVLEALCNIHSRGIIHGTVHPKSILHEEGKVLLDFNFNKQLLKDELCLNGINFQIPKEDLFKSTDMYGFGCLVLWVLFPNLSFQSTDEGVPNICAFQSIIETMLLPKDFASLSALLSINCNIRPASRMLRSNGFLKELRIMSESSSL